MNTSAANTSYANKMPPRSCSWRLRQPEPTAPPPPRLGLDIKSAAAFPSLSAKAETTSKPGQVSISVAPAMNYKATLEKVVPKTKPILLTAKTTNTPKSDSKEFVYDDRYDCEDTVVQVDEEEEGEYNANIINDRRRGDKGFW